MMVASLRMRAAGRWIGPLVLGALILTCSVARAQLDPRPPFPAGWTDLSPSSGTTVAGVDPGLVRYVRARAFAAFAVDLRPENAGDMMWVERPVQRNEITEGTLRAFAERLSGHGQGRIVEQKLCNVGGQPAEKIILESVDGKYVTLIYAYHLRNGKEDAIASYRAGKERFARLRPSLEKLEHADDLRRSR